MVEGKESLLLFLILTGIVFSIYTFVRYPSFKIEEIKRLKRKLLEETINNVLDTNVLGWKKLAAKKKKDKNA